MTRDIVDAGNLDGFEWPLGGYAPGGYSIICGRCKREVINVDKRAFRCLPCAITDQIERADLLRARRTFKAEKTDG